MAEPSYGLDSLEKRLRVEKEWDKIPIAKLEWFKAYVVRVSDFQTTWPSVAGKAQMETNGMKLHIENFMKIARADIQVDGLTVIAGENNTGKSTIGKVLYSLSSIYSAFGARLRAMRRRYVLNPGRFPLLPDLDVDALLADTTLTEESLLERILHEPQTKTMRLLDEALNDQRVPADDDEWGRQLAKELFSRILKCREIPEDAWEVFAVAEEFEKNFRGRMSGLVSTGASDAEIIWEDQGKSIRIDITPPSFTCRSNMALFRKAWFVGHPDLMVAISRGGKGTGLNPIYQSLVREIVASEDGSRNPMVAGMGGEEVLDRLKDVLPGDFKTGDSGQGLLIHSPEFPRGLSVEVLSMGLKTFALLRLMLERGVLRERDMLVLDEPEVHLHPAWQLAYANCIVWLQKAYGLTVLVTTHSPYFLKALASYSREGKIADKTSFYFSRIDGSAGGCVFDDCHGDLNRIFQSLYEPYAELM